MVQLAAMVARVEILMDLNHISDTWINPTICRDPYGSRGSKLAYDGKDVLFIQSSSLSLSTLARRYYKFVQVQFLIRYFL